MKTRKAINFDLSVEMLEDYYPGEDYHQAWKDIKEFMLENGFEHSQYSGYVSKTCLNSSEISALTINMSRNLPWLKYCVERIDVTSVSKQYSLKELLQNTEEWNECNKTINNDKVL